MNPTIFIFAVTVGSTFAMVPLVRVQDAHLKPTIFSFVECEICRLAEPLFVDLVGKEEPEIKSELDKLCKHAPFGLGHKCTDFVDKYLDELVVALQKDGADPKKICADIGACGAEENEVVATKTLQLANIFECAICHALGPELEKLAGKEEHVIVKELEEICKVADFIPGEEKACDGFIEREGAKIAKILSEDQNIGAKELCQKLGVCSAAADARRVARVQLANVIECDICRALGPELEQLAGKEESVIVKELDTICDKLSIFAQACEAIIKKDADRIAKILSEDEGSDAKVLCQKLDMCSANVAELKKTKSGIECFICHTLGPLLEKMAGKEEHIIVKELEKVCASKALTWIPGEEKACDNFIETKGAELAKALAADENVQARELCVIVRAC